LREAESQEVSRGNVPARSPDWTACFSRLVPRSRRIRLRPILTRPIWLRSISRIPLIALMSLAALSASIPLPAQSKPTEYSVKAAYLLNFGKFMRVSPGAVTNPTSFNICIVGDDPFGSSLDQITAGEQIDGRAVQVVRLEKPDIGRPDPGKPESRQCAIAYLSISEEKRMEQDLAAFKDSDTLTVSDAPDFLKRGGMIQLLLVSNHIRFSVNLDPVRRTHLNLSSELLRVAASVSGNRPGEVQP
jgi:hypothetical protein